MAKATITIRQSLQYKSMVASWFAHTQELFNTIAAFYFEVIAAHEAVLELPNKEALTALEKLTHATKKNPNPVMPLDAVAPDCPAMFRRAAIHAALGSARSFYTHLSKWRRDREKANAKGKKWTKRPPVPPRTWNKSTVLYAGQWKERQVGSILLKVWTGTVWSWIRVRLTGREIPEGMEVGSPHLVRHGGTWWLHTPVEKAFEPPPKVEKQVTTTKYQAWNSGIITSRVNPRNTSRECARCGKEIIRYAAGQPEEGYTPGAPLVLCPHCEMRGHADRNAGLVIGKRLIARYHSPSQEKPPTPLLAERESQDSGGLGSHEPETEAVGHSSLSERHGILIGHGTAQNRSSRMVEPVRDITNPLRPQSSRSHATSARGSDDVGVSEATGL